MSAPRPLSLREGCKWTALGGFDYEKHTPWEHAPHGCPADDAQPVEGECFPLIDALRCAKCRAYWEGYDFTMRLLIAKTLADARGEAGVLIEFHAAATP